jgi:hypothetical protein
VLETRGTWSLSVFENMGLRKISDLKGASKRKVKKTA